MPRATSSWLRARASRSGVGGFRSAMEPWPEDVVELAAEAFGEG
jgi:hypothetical protein